MLSDIHSSTLHNIQLQRRNKITFTDGYLKRLKLGQRTSTNNYVFRAQGTIYVNVIS